MVIPTKKKLIGNWKEIRSEWNWKWYSGTGTSAASVAVDRQPRPFQRPKNISPSDV